MRVCMCLGLIIMISDFQIVCDISIVFTLHVTWIVYITPMFRLSVYCRYNGHQSHLLVFFSSFAFAFAKHAALHCSSGIKWDTSRLSYRTMGKYYSICCIACICDRRHNQVVHLTYLNRYYTLYSIAIIYNIEYLFE